MPKFIIGVDEAGRGPLAGPVAVGLVMIRKGFPIRPYFKGVNDSKQVPEVLRESLYEQLRVFHDNGALRFKVLFSSSEDIDEYGISKVVIDRVHEGVYTLAHELRGVVGDEPHELEVLLDGLLHAPTEFVQKTIIGGDAKEPLISLASIAAKVERDRFMHEVAELYPDWGFEKHKGYGTPEHREALDRHGLSAIHRRTYCGSLTLPAAGV